MPHPGGRPSQLSNCSHCGKPFGARALRKHVGVCASAAQTAAQTTGAQTTRTQTTGSEADAVRGRKPKAAGRKLAEGDTRKVGAHRLAAQIAAEQKASPGLPPCPEHLKGRAREAWNFWSEELASMDLDRRPDAHMLEGCCVAYDAAVDAYETILKQGRLIAKKALDPATNKLVVVDVKPHPAVRQGNQAWALMRSFCSEFGLSPVSRIRLSIEKEDAGDADLLELLGRAREKRTPPMMLN